MLHSLGILPINPEVITETFANMDRMAVRINERAPSEVNPAKMVARKLYGRLPLIYGSGITAEVAHRWKTQINENSKTLADYEAFSKLNHNAVVGYKFPEESIHQTMVVMLDSNLLHERIRLRYAATQELLDRAGIPYHILNGEGDSALSQMLTLILLGDYMSYYLGLLNQVDPTPILAVDIHKERLEGK